MWKGLTVFRLTVSIHWEGISKLLPFRSTRNTHPVFSGVHVTRSLVVCVCLVDRCLSFCPFLSAILVSVLLRYTNSDYLPLVSSNSSFIIYDHSKKHWKVLTSVWSRTIKWPKYKFCGRKSCQIFWVYLVKFFQRDASCALN